MASGKNPVDFSIPASIGDWIELRNGYKLKRMTLSGLKDLGSGSKIRPEQFILFRALWLRLRKPEMFKPDSGIQPHHWAKADDVLRDSTSLQRFLQLADGDVSLVNLNEFDSAWPGAFASVTRHQEEITRIDAVQPKRKAGQVPDTRVSRPRLARGNFPARREETSLEVTETLGAGPSSGLLARRPATGLELYPTTLDETVVNVHLVLLIQVVNTRKASNLECTITRVRHVPNFGTNAYTAVVDGAVRNRRTEEVLSILEVKPVVRFGKVIPVQMQETAEAVGWLKHQSGGVPELQDKSRLIIYQGRHEVFLTLMKPGTRYVEYLERTAPTTTADPEEFMTTQTFGPWLINVASDLRSLCLVLLAFLSAAEEVAR